MILVTFFETSRSLFKKVISNLEEVVERKSKVLFFVPDDLVDDIDRYLWTATQDSFLPHLSYKDDRDENKERLKNCPIIVTSKEENINQADVIVFSKMPSMGFIKTFKAVHHYIELDNDKAKANSRAVWSLLSKEEGFEVTIKKEEPDMLDMPMMGEISEQ